MWQLWEGLNQCVLIINSVSEVSMREQGQGRLQARKEWTESIHILNWKRVYFENARFSYVLTLEKKNGGG